MDEPKQRQGIGYQVKKYLAAKAAKDAVKEAAHTAEPEPVPEPEKEIEMASADPRDDTPPTRPAPEVSAPSMADVLAKMTELLSVVAQAKTDPEKDSALKQVELMERLINKTRPENPQSPGISVYSYPEGELTHPKPDLRCPMRWVGYDLRTDTLTPQEILLLNQVQPGDFRVTKADGTTIPFRVTATYADQYDERTQRFKVERLDMWFPCKGDHRQNHGSMTSYLRQVLHGSIPTQEELLAEITRLKQELVISRSGVVGAIA